jgi:sugar (pentulose or hexulose) kinase
MARRDVWESLFQRTGMPMHTMNTITKLLWLRKNEPRIWGRATQWLPYEDYFLHHLTGRAVVSHCPTSRRKMYDLGISALARASWPQLQQASMRIFRRLRPAL